MRLEKVRWALALLALAVGGCAVDQEKEVATYRRVLDGGQPAEAVTYAAGEPLSLEEAMALANQHNERLGLRGEDYLQALIAKDRAAAVFLPTINLVPIYFAQARTKAGSKDNDLNTGSAAPRDERFDVPVTGQMNLFNGFSDLASYRAAGRTIEERRALLMDAQAAVLLDVARTYYQVLRSEGSVEVLKNSLALQDERVRDIRARQRVGVARPLEVAQTEAQASATRVLLLAAQNDVVNGRAVLGSLIGAAVGSGELVDRTTIPGTGPSLLELEEHAMQERQDLVAAAAAIESARFDVQAAVGEYYPSVSFNVAYFLQRQSLPTESDWNAILSANLPIFRGGVIHADVRRAWSLLRQAKLFESLTRRLVLQEVQIAYENLMSSRERVKELEVQLRAATEAVRQADQSYRVGLATNLERLSAQDQLLSAQLHLSSERFDQKVFYLALLRAIGKLSTSLPGEPGPATQPATSQTVATSLGN